MQHLGANLEAEQLQTAVPAESLVGAQGAKTVDVGKTVHRLPAVTQLLQGAHTQAAEGKGAAPAKHPSRLAEHAGEIFAPLQGQAGKDQVQASIAQRQAFGVASYEIPRASLRPGMAQHSFGDIQCDTLGVHEAASQHAGEIAGAATQIEPAGDLQIGGQPRQQLVADLPLQGRDAVVAGRRAGKGRGDLALVRQQGGAVSHPRPHP